MGCEMRTGYIKKLDSGEYSLMSKGEVIVKANTVSELVDIGKTLGLSPLKVYEFEQDAYEDEILAGGDNLKKCFDNEEVRAAWYDFMSFLLSNDSTTLSNDPIAFAEILASKFESSLSKEMRNVLSQGS
jgi:hypothetical protein